MSRLLLNIKIGRGLRRILVKMIVNFAPRARRSILVKLPMLNRFLRSRLDSLPVPTEGKIHFAGEEWFSHSQAFQDVFVQVFGEHHVHRTYLEIGSGHPEKSNNSLVLERNGWVGTSIEIDDRYLSVWESARKNRLIIGDALKVDYDFELKKICGPDGYIGYLQIDIEPAWASLEALKKIVSGPHRFASITFEHDAYRFGEHIRSASRDMLSDLGYRRIVSDVEWSPGSNFEDWWIHPGAFPQYISSLQDDKRWFSKFNESEFRRFRQIPERKKK